MVITVSKNLYERHGYSFFHQWIRKNLCLTRRWDLNYALLDNQFDCFKSEHPLYDDWEFIFVDKQAAMLFKLRFGDIQRCVIEQ